MIKTKTYSIKNQLLTNKVLGAYINNFWDDIFSPIKDNQHLMLMCKIQYSEIELGYRTLGHLRRVNFNEKQLFIDYLISRLGILNDSYTSLAISKIVFSYVNVKGLATNKDRRLFTDLEDKSLSTHRFNNMNLPITMEPGDYGKILLSKVIDNFTRFIVSSGKLLYQIDVSLDNLINKVTILGNIDLSWTDIKLDDGFKREIGKSTIYFLDGEIVLRKQILPAKPFKVLREREENYSTIL
jgi:hypothetical protein